MVTTLAYDMLVQKLLNDGKCVSRSEARRVATLSAEKEVRGNVESKVLSPEECEGEVDKMIDGAVSIFSGPNPEVIVTKKRGRPKGSRNRPKEAK